ncbi:flagellar type III secretion system pore protein FliP [Agromyces sp. G08B096]|uniref:Flagellar biosynthetic protein FliP n=1 Tax=Agromyces sp. G08B096 TaxID=3156399 RepID=A0AAU7WAQ0_9MICO
MTPASTGSRRSGKPARVAAIAAASTVIALLLVATQTLPGFAEPIDPAPPAEPAPPADNGGGYGVEINGPDGTPSSAIVTLISITLLAVAPSLLIMMTSFTKIFVVLAMARNALSLPAVPPNQVLAGLALFLSIFVMQPVLTQVNELGVQPYLDGTLDFGQAVEAGSAPLREWMLSFTREEDLALMTRAAGLPNPEDAAAVDFATLIPAFLISELRSAFIIGFVVFVPFLVIDLVVSAALMSMGMMMLPPVMISLPFKILLFILVDGWGLLATTLVSSYRGGG